MALGKDSQESHLLVTVVSQVNCSFLYITLRKSKHREIKCALKRAAASRFNHWTFLIPAWDHGKKSLLHTKLLIHNPRLLPSTVWQASIMHFLTISIGTIWLGLFISKTSNLSKQQRTKGASSVSVRLNVRHIIETFKGSLFSWVFI